MVKIIKEGKLPEKVEFIYTGECSFCGCEFEFEQEDFKFIERTINGLRVVECPCCHNEIKKATSFWNKHCRRK